MAADDRERFLTLLRSAVQTDRFVKLTLGRYRGSDATLRNLFVRPVILKSGPRLAFVWRHKTRDISKNHSPEEGLSLLAPLIGGDFLDAHLFTHAHVAQLEVAPGSAPRIRIAANAPAPAASVAHDRSKVRPIPPDARWLQALGITDSRGKPREGMAPKFRQIQKFAELLAHLVGEAGLAAQGGGAPSPAPLEIVDMGCGKGYLTFAISGLLGDAARVRGIEVRRDLVELCNKVASDNGLSSRLSFSAGTIADTSLDGIDILIALHACDTATDDAIAKGIAAGAGLIMVAPCCQKELRPQLVAPPVFEPVLRHGIFLERHAEFATDALRALLLEWSGYRTKAFEFVPTEHTAKNLMIAAIKGGSPDASACASRIRAFSSFYGITRHALARHLNFDLRSG